MWYSCPPHSCSCVACDLDRRETCGARGVISPARLPRESLRPFRDSCRSRFSHSTVPLSQRLHVRSNARRARARRSAPMDDRAQRRARWCRFAMPQPMVRWRPVRSRSPSCRLRNDPDRGGGGKQQVLCDGRRSAIVRLFAGDGRESATATCSSRKGRPQVKVRKPGLNSTLS